MHAAEPFASVVHTESGALRGADAGGVLRFAGIPYAAPPVGARRWLPPAPAAAWTGVRDAAGFGPDCAQLPVPGDVATPRSGTSEDCLTLNVWRPAAEGRGLPVMVWIHGGGFLNGGSSPPVYSGAASARDGVVFVSLNYRLARFGFFAFPGVPEPNPGLLDQVAALEWVRRNIAAFGGDPARVTVVGESAGGMAIHALLTGPAVPRDLFARAAIMSGGDGRLLLAPPAEAAFACARFARRAAGVEPGAPDALERLRALPAAAVVGGLNMEALSATPPSEWDWTPPVIDGRIVVDAAAAYAAGAFARVPVMIGATSADLFGPGGAMEAGARDVARAIAAHGVAAFLYRFSYVAGPAGAPASAGAGHASDVPYFLGTLDAVDPAPSARDRAAERLAHGALMRFVHDGDPNGGALPSWPRMAGADARMLDFDAAAGATVAAP